MAGDSPDGCALDAALLPPAIDANVKSHTAVRIVGDQSRQEDEFQRIGPGSRSGRLQIAFAETDNEAARRSRPVSSLPHLENLKVIWGCASMSF